MLQNSVSSRGVPRDDGSSDKLIDSRYLRALIAEYEKAPSLYHVTPYWASYQMGVRRQALEARGADLRSGRYGYLATFGFVDTAYRHHAKPERMRNPVRRLVHRLLAGRGTFLPYGVTQRDLQEMAYRHCELLGEINGARPISSIETSDFGGPADIFEIHGRRYTVNFLNYYVRYCFAHRHIRFRGGETVVELGSGSGYQIEVLKKLYPDLTILCFDLPAQLLLCQSYLTAVFGDSSIVGALETMHWDDLSRLRPGKIHFLGNWKMPLLRSAAFDVFWNAASFGEMEPHVVRNYLDQVRGRARYIYLLQAAAGKKSSSAATVRTPITSDDYPGFIPDYVEEAHEDAYSALKRMRQTGGYFQSVWRLREAAGITSR